MRQPCVERGGKKRKEKGKTRERKKKNVGKLPEVKKKKEKKSREKTGSGFRLSKPKKKIPRAQKL